MLTNVQSSLKCPAFRLSGYWLGKWPTSYHKLWVVKAFVLFTARYFLYKRQKLHYMMCEWKTSIM